MAIKHVYAPTKGIATSIPPTMLPQEASPYMKGVYLKDGEVRSDFGHTDFPVTGDTTANNLTGSVMKLDSFKTYGGLSFLICMTTQNLYHYNTSTTTWDCITQGNLIADCESPWDAGTGVATNAYDAIKMRGQTSACGTVLVSVPVAHFPLDDDAADTDVEDTGGDNTATASANTDTLSVAAVVDDGFDFEFATGHYVTIGAAMAAQYTDTVGSIAVWANVESLTAERVICAGSDASGTSMLVLSVTTAGAVRAYMHNGTAMQWDVQTADDCIAVDTDYHIVLVQNGTSAKIYLDTEDEDLVTNTSTDLTTWFADIADVDTALMGALSTGGLGAAHFFDGILDDFRYYDEAISTRDVFGLYNNGEGTGEVGGFTTGVMVSEDDISTADISGALNTHLSYWIRADKAVAAEAFSIRLSEQATGGTGATYADYFVPALIADEWLHVRVALATPDADDGGDYPDDINVLASVALVANDTMVSGIVVYVDDIRTVEGFTGDEDNRFSTATMNDTFIFTNGIDVPQKITETGGALTVADLTTTLATGAITTSEVVVAFKDHLCLMQNTENAADCPQRVSWTNIGTIEDWTHGTAGYQDLVDDASWIESSLQMGENEHIIYKEDSIVKMTWVGGQTPLRFMTMVAGKGLMANEAVADIGGEHILIGSDSIHSYKGGTDVTDIDLPLRQTFYDAVDKSYSNRSFLIYIEEDEELQLWIPTTTNYPDDIWCYDIRLRTWYRKTRTMTGFGFYSEASSLTIGDLVGTIGEQNWKFGDALTKANTPITLVGDTNGKVYKLDKTSLNNDGTAITNEFQTPDFTIPKADEFVDRFMRVSQLIFEATGQSVTTSWSSDGGSTWYPTATATNNTTSLDSNFTLYQQDFDTVARKIRFRFVNNTASSGFQLRYYGFDWKIRSRRR